MRVYKNVASNGDVAYKLLRCTDLAFVQYSSEWPVSALIKKVGRCGDVCRPLAWLFTVPSDGADAVYDITVTSSSELRYVTIRHEVDGQEEETSYKARLPQGCRRHCVDGCISPLRLSGCDMTLEVMCQTEPCVQVMNVLYGDDRIRRAECMPAIHGYTAAANYWSPDDQALSVDRLPDVSVGSSTD